MSSLPPESSSLYVLNCLDTEKFVMNHMAEAMKDRREKIEKQLAADKDTARDSYEELIKTQSKLLTSIDSCVLYLHEIGDTQLADYGRALSTQIKQFNLMTRDYSIFVKVIADFSARLPEIATTNASIIGRLMNSVKMGFYPTDLDNVGHIMDGITFPEGVTTNLLDPCCGEGKALKKLAVGNNCFTYGAELDESRAEKAQEKLHRVAVGSFFYSRMSHEAFHVLFLNPPYLSVIGEGGKKAREERRFLIESMPHLMMGGLLIYIIPYYRLTPDICRIFCDNFTDISIHRFTDSEFKRFQQVVVMGKKIQKTDGSEAAELLSELVYDPNAVPCITEIEPGRYSLPAIAKKVELFKGAVFNEVELQRQLRESKSFDKLLNSKKLQEGIRQPPLPFTFAQLGLIGGSGLINGFVECDSPHVIKGRIVKETKINREPTYSRSGKLVSTEIKEVVSNKMIFNILTPEGFKSLA